MLQAESGRVMLYRQRERQLIGCLPNYIERLMGQDAGLGEVLSLRGGDLSLWREGQHVPVLPLEFDGGRRQGSSGHWLGKRGQVRVSKSCYF